MDTVARKVMELYTNQKGKHKTEFSDLELQCLVGQGLVFLQAYDAQPNPAKSARRWRKAVWLGKDPRTGLHLVGGIWGVSTARTVRCLPSEKAYVPGDLDNVRGSPWSSTARSLVEKDAFSVVDIKPQRLKRFDDEAASDPAETPGNSGSENEADNLGLASAAVAQAGGDSPKRMREQSAGSLQSLAAVLQHFESHSHVKSQDDCEVTHTHPAPQEWSRSRSRQTRSQSTRSRQTRSQSTTRRAPVWIEWSSGLL